MKLVIFAGGLGTRLSEETSVRPKPMVEIGGKPILWHIMKIYSHYGINDFVICTGYKAHVIYDYFAEYARNASDVTFDLGQHTMEIHKTQSEPWRVTIVNTGTDTLTAGRLQQVLPYIGDETFCLTYGDGVSDIDISKLISFHKSHGRCATVTAVLPPGRFGIMELKNDDDIVDAFREKPTTGGGGWINGGFFVLEPTISQYLPTDATSTDFSKEPLERLTHDQQLVAYRYGGFWQPVDTLQDKNKLEKLWAGGAPPWKIW